MFADHRTDCELQIIKLLNTAMSHARTKIILLLQMLLSCRHLHNEDPGDGKRARKARSEGHPHRIIRNVQKSSQTMIPYRQTRSNWESW